MLGAILIARRKGRSESGRRCVLLCDSVLVPRLVVDALSRSAGRAQSCRSVVRRTPEFSISLKGGWFEICLASYSRSFSAFVWQLEAANVRLVALESCCWVQGSFAF